MVGRDGVKVLPENLINPFDRRRLSPLTCSCYCIINIDMMCIHLILSIAVMTCRSVGWCRRTGQTTKFAEDDFKLQNEKMTVTNSTTSYQSQTVREIVCSLLIATRKHQTARDWHANTLHVSACPSLYSHVHTSCLHILMENIRIP